MILVQDYEPAEVINVIKDYVIHFFGCRECGENFAKETVDSAKFIIKSNDEVLYLWKVHNNVNKRLAGDQETEDPKHKKIQFPSKLKCPNCYKTNKIIGSIKTDDSEFNEEEILKYLISFYSIGNIVGAEAMTKEKLDPVVSNHNNNPKTDKKVLAEEVVGVRDNLNHDVKPVNVDEIVRIPDPIDEKKQPLPKHGDRNRIDYDLVHKGGLPIEDHTIHLDVFLTIAIYLLVILAFACLFLYYKMLRKRSFRVKRKYIL